MYEQLLEEGRQEVRIDTLLDLLEAKFGPVPPLVRARVRKAGPPTLQRWTINVLTAKTRDAVFAAQATSRATRSSNRKNATS